MSKDRTTVPGLAMVAMGALGLYWLWRSTPKSIEPQNPVDDPIDVPTGNRPVTMDDLQLMKPVQPFVPLPVRVVEPGELSTWHEAL